MLKQVMTSSSVAKPMLLATANKNKGYYQTNSTITSTTTTTTTIIAPGNSDKSNVYTTVDSNKDNNALTEYIKNTYLHFNNVIPKYMKITSIVTTSTTTSRTKMDFDTYKQEIEQQLEINSKHLKMIEENNYVGANCPKLDAYLNGKCVSNANSNGSRCDRVFFFDIDNCLYKKSLKIHDLMQIYIRKFFLYALNLPNEEAAAELNAKYYKEYGLAIKGLLENHSELGIDALEYNRLVDDALPLQKILKPDMKLRKILCDLKDSNKIDKLWLFTNAYRTHAMRVVKILGIADLFDGITYCDYARNDKMICKPDPLCYELALKESGLSGVSGKNAYFIDDSLDNIKTANNLNFCKAIHIDEYYEDSNEDFKRNGIYTIKSFKELPKVVPELF
ncbi:nucleotidase SCDLUD_002297 [Saccharomycodes ludwigii]|uniref:nucleotidase n=1 Tax=Saccharomycodes ludwigii TaxID=36035 RepID=UPI001E8A20F1|nr:hypothetical protein SCDLUD_002297 [Saccharomycodes ludwigii]KAH3900843.1 hypothetical protein SCDLUD_002297 [Saccharomycodes ludwigii]